MSLKHKVEGNELDLSLNELTEVQVKELAAVPKAILLDLSCNRIQTLPNDFATLTHLVKIDLSRNKLTELPSNFGNLINLQYLDFEGNQLKTLPVSFCRLKNLRWLDLKGNPLEPKLKSFAGDCLDGNQCQTCAKKVVAYMQTIDSNLEREKQKKLKEMREKEALAKAKLEKELEEQRRFKKLEKERRKAESRAKNEKESKQNKNNIEKSSDCTEDVRMENITNEEKRGLHWCTLFLPAICILAAILIYFFSTANGLDLQNISIPDMKLFVQRHSLRLSQSSIKFYNSTIIPLALHFKVYFLRNIHSIMVYISNVASQIELLLSFYF